MKYYTLLVFILSSCLTPEPIPAPPEVIQSTVVGVYRLDTGTVQSMFLSGVKQTFSDGTVVKKMYLERDRATGSYFLYRSGSSVGGDCRLSRTIGSGGADGLVTINLKAQATETCMATGCKSCTFKSDDGDTKCVCVSEKTMVPYAVTSNRDLYP